nr:MAG TPA: hypothetical protein [Caudoviricetes sp.]
MPNATYLCPCPGNPMVKPLLEIDVTVTWFLYNCSPLLLLVCITT